MWLRTRTRRQARETIHADGPEPVDVEDVVHALEQAVLEGVKMATQLVFQERSKALSLRFYVRVCRF